MSAGQQHTAEPFEELYCLLDDLCDGSLSAEDAARLDGMLRSDAAARWEYLSYLDVHAGLGLIAGGAEESGREEGRGTRVKRD